MWGLKRRALVYDNAANSCKIKVESRIEERPQDYWSFDFGPRDKSRNDSWDLFVDKEKTQIQAVRPEEPLENGIHVTGLRLDNLGGWGKILRKTGVLNRGYVQKSGFNINAP
jgi:hypothetical protein